MTYGIYGSKKKCTEFRVDGIPWTPYMERFKKHKNEATLSH
jgi:hypothetical protein